MKIWNRIGTLELGLASIGAGACLFIIMIVTVLSVFGRYVLAMDLVPGAFNMIERVFFPLMVFWAMPLAYREGAFPRLDFVVESFPGRIKAAVAVFIVAVEMIIFVALAWYAARFALDGIASRLTTPIGTNQWPIYPVLAMVPLALALMVIDMAMLLWADLCKVLWGSVSEPEPGDDRNTVLD